MSLYLGIWERKRSVLSFSTRLCQCVRCHRVCRTQLGTSEGSQAKPVLGRKQWIPGFSTAPHLPFRSPLCFLCPCTSQAIQARVGVHIPVILLAALRRSSVAFCFHLPYLGRHGARYSWKGPFHPFQALLPLYLILRRTRACSELGVPGPKGYLTGSRAGGDWVSG